MSSRVAFTAAPFHHSQGNWRSPTRLHADSGLVDDALVTRVTTDWPPGQPFRTAAVGGLALISFLAGLVPVIWRAGQETLAAAAVFLVGSVFSVLGRTPERGSSLVGVGLFIVWMLAVSVGLWRTALGGV